MTPALDVWWGPSLVATVEERRGRITTRYESAAEHMLSVAMPVRTKPYGEKASRPFFHGLLPEGETRRTIAYDLGLGTQGGDDIALLSAIGRDCAGALVVLPSGSDAPPTTSGLLEPLTGQEVAERIRDLPLNPLGVDDRVRVSLPGVQNKLLLARTPDGAWALPLDGVPSTHILKPAIRDMPESVDNEHFCQIVAARAGVHTADTTKASFDDLPVLVSTRFDRRTEPDGTVTRLHQEDACQALSVLTIPIERKYQSNPKQPPSFRGIAQILDQWGDTDSRDALVDQMAISVVLGNADLHGKNLTLIHRDGRIALSPVYDLMSTTGLSPSISTNMGMYVNDKRDIHSVTYEDLIEEATSWGLRHSSAVAKVHGLLDRLPEVIEDAADGLDETPASLVDHLLRRSRDARDGSTSAHPPSTVARVLPRQPAGTQRCGSTNTRTGRPCQNPPGCTVPGHHRR